MGNNRCSIYDATSGDFRRCFGEAAPAADGACHPNEAVVQGELPLRQPYDVVVAFNMYVVSEYAGRRVLAFARCGAPLQTLSPPGVGALGGLACDGDWLYVLDESKGRPSTRRSSRSPSPSPSPQPRYVLDVSKGRLLSLTQRQPADISLLQQQQPSTRLSIHDYVRRGAMS